MQYASREIFIVIIIWIELDNEKKNSTQEEERERDLQTDRRDRKVVRGTSDPSSRLLLPTRGYTRPAKNTVNASERATDRDCIGSGATTLPANLDRDANNCFYFFTATLPPPSSRSWRIHLYLLSSLWRISPINQPLIEPSSPIAHL